MWDLIEKQKSILDKNKQQKKFAHDLNFSLQK